MIKSKVKTVLRLFNEKRVTTVAGAWVYYFLTSVIPLAFLVITAFGVFGVSVSKEIVARLPEEFRAAGETIASTAENASKGVTALFVFTIIFSCTTLLNQMSKDGDFIYGVKSKIKRGVMRRIWALVALAALFTVFLGAAVLFAFGNMIFAQARRISAYRLLFTVLAFTLIIAFGYLIIMLLNRFISPVRLKFAQVSIGALVSVFIIVLGTIFFILYLRFFANYNAFYGSLAAIIVFLLWTYISMLGLVVGVIINERIYSIMRSDSAILVTVRRSANKKRFKKA
ncbi:MAG: YihY/virulence factor BrkB family protein [Clostridia bacterium]|nr:YihY/virulence factor BrkB family protein [Clostridia bacterium]